MDGVEGAPKSLPRRHLGPTCLSLPVPRRHEPGRGNGETGLTLPRNGVTFPRMCRAHETPDPEAEMKGADLGSANAAKGAEAETWEPRTYKVILTWKGTHGTFLLSATSFVAALDAGRTKAKGFAIVLAQHFGHPVKVEEISINVAQQSEQLEIQL
jgi:hypothetical protein